MPEEEKEFLNYLSAWEIYAYPPHTFRKSSDVKPIPLLDVLKSNPSQVSFGSKQFLSDRDIGQRNIVDDVQYYGVSPMQSQTIAYQRPFFHKNGALGKANLSFYSEYPNEEAIGFIKKDADFIKWAKKVIGWSRKRACEKLLLNGYPYMATTKVKELVERSELTLGH
jgi:hypothetical protein